MHLTFERARKDAEALTAAAASKSSRRAKAPAKGSPEKPKQPKKNSRLAVMDSSDEDGDDMVSDCD